MTGCAQRREAARADLPEWQNVYTTSYAQGTTESLLPVFTSFASDGYKGNSIVFSVILARLMLFSEAEFKFQNLTDKRLFGTADLAPVGEPVAGRNNRRPVGAHGAGRVP